MDNTIGFNYSLIVSGNQFVNRTEELSELLSGIERGLKYSIYGQKKIGKTSLVYKIMERLGSTESVGTSQNYKIAYINCGEICSEIHLWQAITDDLCT